MAALTPFGNACAGALGGVVSNAIVYPLDTIKTRLQAEDGKAKQAALPAPSDEGSLSRPGAPSKIDIPAAVDQVKKVTVAKAAGTRAIMLKIWKEHGLAGFYRGFGASMLNTFSMQFAYFYWYTIVRTTYVTRRFGKTGATAKLNTLTELALGALAGAFAQIFTIPVSVIATRQQLADKATGFFATMNAILADDGITGLWRGLKPSLVLTVNPAITYGMFERLKTAVLKEGEKMTPGKAFYIGAASKTMATVVTYPYILSKIRLQAKYDDSEDEVAPVATAGAGAVAKKKRKEKYSGAIDVLQQIYKEKGLAGWYQGMQAQITKAVISQALLFGIKDMLEAYVVLALLYSSKITGKAAGVAV